MRDKYLIIFSLCVAEEKKEEEDDGKKRKDSDEEATTLCAAIKQLFRLFFTAVKQLVRFHCIVPIA
jgi:hypothetical protein